MASIYKRNGRYWGNFVDFEDREGRCEPLKAPGEEHATKSFRTATDLFHRRIAQFEELRKSKTNADPTWERGPNAITLVSAMERYVAAEATFVGSRSASHWRRYTRIIADAASTTQDATFSFQKCLLSDRAGWRVACVETAPRAGREEGGPRALVGAPGQLHRLDQRPQPCPPG